MKIFKLFISVALLTACTSVFAFQVREVDLEQKVKASTLVVIGTVQSVSTEDCYPDYYCATIKVQYFLKGNKNKKAVRVAFGGPMAEMGSYCCSEGEKYLFFLSPFGERYYRSTNGPHGIYPIGNDTHP